MSVLGKAVKSTALVALGVGLGCAFGAATVGAGSSTSDTYRQINLFGDVFERVRADYVEKVSDEQLIEAAMNGMLSSLDPHSSYLNDKSFKDLQIQTDGAFGGLGAEVTMENGVIKVVSPIDDTPAARAGLQPGDLIVALDGVPVLGMSFNEAVDKMRGAVDTPIKIQVRRGASGDPFEVTLKRAIVTVPSVRSSIDGDIGYIRITGFNKQTQVGIDKAIQSFEKDGGGKIKGYVLDLRNNPGGLLDQAVSVSDTFIDKGEIVSIRGNKKDDAVRYNAKSKAQDALKGAPLVVLINYGSASASEIVAGALQDHKRAIIMGTQSFGKGSVQSIIPLAPGQGAIRLTTARYYTPSGRSIQQLGITPDINVPAAKVEEIPTGARPREADLKGALVNDQSKGGAQPKPPAADADAPGDADARPAVDYQLERARDLLRGIVMWRDRDPTRQTVPVTTGK